MMRGQFIFRLSIVCSAVCVAATVYALRALTSLGGLSVAVIATVVVVLFYALFVYVVTKLGW